MIIPDAYCSDTTATRSRELAFTLGAGPSYFVGRAGVPQHLDTQVDLIGPAFTARLMWHPDHLIRVGLESGRTTLYSYSIDGPGPSGSVDVTAIPLLLVWSMRITPRLEAYAGWGTYRLTSTLDHLGRVRTSSFSQGYVAAVSYGIPIGERFHTAMEFKWMNAFVTDHHLLALQWRLDWKFLQW